MYHSECGCLLAPPEPDFTDYGSPIDWDAYQADHDQWESEWISSKAAHEAHCSAFDERGFLKLDHSSGIVGTVHFA